MASFWQFLHLFGIHRFDDFKTNSKGGWAVYTQYCIFCQRSGWEIQMEKMAKLQKRKDKQALTI